MDPRCKGMPLSSFILKPMQRVTRYPLIIKNVSAPPFRGRSAPHSRRQGHGVRPAPPCPWVESGTNRGWSICAVCPGESSCLSRKS